MQLLLLALLATIAAILFYRLVERRHKIAVAKGIGVLVVLLLLGVGYLWNADRRAGIRRARIQESVKIRFAPDSAYTARYSKDNPFLHFLQRTDTLHAISFTLCNAGTGTVESVSFTPTTWRTGRSTQHDVVVSTSVVDQYVDSRLNSDFVLEPGACNTLTWPARGLRAFVLMDSVSATGVSVSIRER